MDNKGTISINAKNMMPIIKKWLYSDKDIFLREIVSNGCDAIAKYSALVRTGEAAADEYKVTVHIDKENGTLSVTDNGIGMTEEEVVKYISQVAFSGAEEFLEKYKDEEGGKNGIIGHFGLGFYSSFMVSERVTIDTLSYSEGAKAVRWESEDGMEYTLTPSERTQRGTTVTMKLAEDSKEFLEEYTVRETLDKYCSFMPTPIFLDVAGKTVKVPKGGEGEDKDEQVEVPAEPVQINDTHPLWSKKPTECTEDEYKEFYRKVFHVYDEPLFWIHLNAEYPFNLKGILYFPKLKNEFTANEGMIKLYNNQVFVADNIKEVIPDFLMLLKGAIDCPDLPLNVSRSFLQNDGYVKRMQSYITRKVADRLITEFNTKRADYEKYWGDIHPFVKYGCVRDEKFYERVKDAILFKTSDDRFMTIKEYSDANFSGDDKTVLYTSDPRRQAHLIDVYKEQGRDVVVMDTLIDNNFMSFMEYGPKEEERISFRRVDAATESLTEKEGDDEEARKQLEELFRKASGDDTLEVKLSAFKTEDIPAVITVDEQMRRYSEMSRAWGGGFSMPEKRTLTVNTRHALYAYIHNSSENDDLRTQVCAQIYDLAEMARQPLESERMVAFLKRSNELLTKIAK